MSGVQDKERKRVWIDSQTEEEILRGIREAKDLSAYDNLGNAAYLRAKEDYLMGINFQSPDVKIRQHGKRVSQKRPGSDFCGSCHDLCPRNDREQRAGDPFVHQDSLLPGDR